jgi:hypothetical protein
MISLLKNAFLGALIVPLFAIGDVGRIDIEHEAAPHESQVLFYDWKKDEQYGYKINRIVQELDLSEFHSIIVRCDSPEMPDGNYIVTPDSPELPGAKMYYSLKMQDGKMYSFPRVIPAPGTPCEDVSNKVKLKGFRNIGESVWKDSINNTYLVSDILIDIENKSESPIILLRACLAGNEGFVLPRFECNHELYTIIHESNIYIPPMSVYRLHGKIIPYPANLRIKPSRKTHDMKLPEKMNDVYIELAFQSVIIGKKLQVDSELPQKFIYRSKFTKGSY